MKLNHINLGVTDVPAATDFLVRHFGLRLAEHMPQTDAMGFTLDDNDALISVFKARDATYPKIFHIGFLQDSRDAVDAMHDQLSADGCEPGSRATEHGRYVFYVNAPGGFVVEVSCVV
jgi:catechol 2,3-dioxygenase-like lactoylglutathione lyase family enzyme